MAQLTLYGSAVADSTLTTACLMAPALGGVETSKQTVINGAGQTDCELWSQGNAGIAGFTSIQPPDGHGWVYYPGAGTFAAGNWSASFTMSLVLNGATGSTTIRFYKLSGGVYTSIGTINVATITIAKTTYTFTATSMPTMTFGSGDAFYTDLWYHDASSSANGDNPTVFLSNSATQGVANDMAVTTANFTPAVTGPKPRYVPRAFGGTIVPDPVTQPLAYVRRALGATLIYEDRTFIPRAFGGVYIPDTVLWVPRAFGGTTSLPLATTTTYSFVDALTASDSLLVVDIDIPLDGLSASDNLLGADGCLYTEANVASDSLGGGGTGTFTDGISTSDSLLESEAFIPLEANTANDALLKVDGYLPLDALTAADALLGTDPYLPLDGLTGATTPLEWDIYLPTDDGLSASDSSSMTQVPPGGGPINNTYSFTDALVASDALLAGLVDIPLDGMTVADTLVCSAGAGLIDALLASDMGGLARSFVEALSISDTLVQSDVYLPADVQNVLESVLAGDNTLWVDALLASDTFTSLVTSSQPLQYINVIWVTRDMNATWTTRDGKATWVTRDDKAGWKTRDEQASWKTRDELVTWKARS